MFLREVVNIRLNVLLEIYAVWGINIDSVYRYSLGNNNSFAVKKFFKKEGCRYDTGLESFFCSPCVCWVLYRFLGYLSQSENMHVS